MSLRPLAICFSVLLFSAQLAQADADFDKLLAKSSAATKRLQTLTAKIDFSWQTPGVSLKKNTGTIKLMKPNYALLSVTGDYPLITLASDGSSLYTLTEPTKYTIANAEPQGKNIATPWWAFPVRFFFSQSIKPFGPDSPLWTKSRYVGLETLKGERYQVVEIEGETPMPYVAKFYFDDRNILRRSTVAFGEGSGAATFAAEINGVTLERRFRRNEFTFHPPATAKLDTGAEAKMLAIGAVAPDFALPTPEGNTVTFADLRRGKKATLVNFWYLACPPCREEFELFQRLHTEWKDLGLAIVAINKVDDAPEIRSYVRQHRITFPIVMDRHDGPGILGTYQIETYPSSYVLDSDGKIVYRFVGLDEAGLRQALNKLGLKK